MKRGRETKWTVDWPYNRQLPKVGDIVKRMTATNADGGTWQVTGVRRVKVRKPLEPGYCIRFKLTVQYLSEASGRQIDWSMFERRRAPRPPRSPAPITADPFSPLL